MLAQAAAPAVPWQGGEKQTYNFTWVGVQAGQLVLEAKPWNQGWYYRGEFIPQGLGRWLGYGLEAESWVSPELYSLRFNKVLTEPFKGKTWLRSETSAQGVEATITEPDGKKRTWKSPATDVFDDLSVIFYLRYNPEAKVLKVVDYPNLTQGRIENLGKSSEGWLGYRYSQEGLLIEAWFKPDARRTLMRMVFGRDWGRLEARLIEP